MAKSHDLFDFMRTATREMQEDYERIQKRASEDPGTAGDQGEEDWKRLFANWLPPMYQVVTKGRILSAEGIASPQVDVLVLHPTYPRKLLDKKLYLASSVAAAFECKLTLRSGHIRKLFHNAVEIRKHLLPRIGSAYKELHSPIVYGLLTHSHNWKGVKSTPIQNVRRHLANADWRFVHHPRQMVDFICVADLATWVGMKSAEEVPKTWYSLHPARQKSRGTNHSPISTPIGAMLVYLLLRLAWEDASVRNLADYFHRVELAGSGVGAARQWSSSVFQQETWDRIVTERDQDALSQKWSDYWSEWRAIYP